MLKFLIKAITNALGFSKVEARGTLVLIFIMIVSLACFRMYLKSLKNPTIPDPKQAAELEKWVAEVKASFQIRPDEMAEEQNGFDKSVYFPTAKTYSEKRDEKEDSFGAKEEEYVPKILKEESIIIRDLNTATAKDLQMVHGIGPSFSDRIVKFRNRLGGFFENAQLEEVYGLEAETINEIKKYFEVQSPPKSIDINADSAKVLANHPYISYDLAWIIINYRKQNGDIISANDLKNIQAIDQETFARLKPYLD